MCKSCLSVLKIFAVFQLHHPPMRRLTSPIFCFTTYKQQKAGQGPGHKAALFRNWSAVHNHNVPCAVCYVSTRVAVTMIPAKTWCPSTWTLEYSGYLMSEARLWNDHTRTMYKCVDKNPDSVPGSASSTNGALFYHVEASCNGMLCPPCDPQKELTCAVCTNRGRYFICRRRYL